MANESRLDELRRGRADQKTDAPGADQTPVPRPAVRWKTRVLLPGVMMLSVVALLAYSAGDVLRPATVVDVLPVVVKSSARGVSGGGVVAQGPGWVEPAPFAVSVPALADGIVSEVLVLEGQSVQAGQVVARLIDDDARLALAGAEAQLALRQADLAEAEVAAGLAGDQTAKTLSVSDKLAGSPEATALARAKLDLENFPSQLAVQQARQAELKTELAAKETAARSGVISAVPVNLLKARLEAQQAEIKALHVQERILTARLKRLEVQVAGDLARAKASLAAAQAARDEAKLRLDRMDVRAPASGAVLVRHAEPGTAVTGVGSAAKPLVQLYDPRRLQVRVDVALSTAAQVGVGQEARIVVDVLPDEVFEGKVVRVVHEADIQRNTLQFKVSIDNPSPLLKPEMLARVRFISPRREVQGDAAIERIFAPIEAVGSEAGKTVTVWVADLSNQVARRREVTLGAVSLDDLIEVSSGLNAGDRIIVSPADGLADGQQIRLKGDRRHGSH